MTPPGGEVRALIENHLIDLTLNEVPAFMPNVRPWEGKYDDDLEYLGSTSRQSSIPDDSKINLASYEYNSILLKPGMDVELLDGDFLRIYEISEDVHTEEVTLKGALFQRTSRCEGKVNKKLNDIVMMLLASEDNNSAVEECLATQSVTDVAVQREIIITNQEWSAYTSEERRGDYKWRKAYGNLVCRWICRQVLNPNKSKIEAEHMERPTEEECDTSRSASAVLKWQLWRSSAKDEKETSPQMKRRTNASAARLNSKSTHAVDADVDLTDSYSCGDICCGAGGTARGMHENGLEVQFALDHDEVACQTFRSNFSGAKVLHEDIFNFITWKGNQYRGYIKVDILHISFPCQPHSPAHTVAGVNDDANIAAQFSVMYFLALCRPRIVTFEQTSGILRGEAVHYKALLNQLTSMGYSYRSKVCVLCDYGLAQPRKRLIIIAACPGEAVPPFPKKTHGPGLLPYTTIADALKTVPAHYPEVMHESVPKDGESYNPKVQLERCITTSGGDNLHPSGIRGFDCQELAALQGFPGSHRFEGNKTQIRKQIGNAVPPIFAKRLFAPIIESMRAHDRKVAAYKTPMVVLD